MAETGVLCCSTLLSLCLEDKEQIQVLLTCQDTEGMRSTQA